MPKQSQRANVNAFIKGLITEASPINFPANASIDELNFEIKTDGTRRRRLGMDYEDNYAFNAVTSAFSLTAANTNTFLWESVNGDSSLTFLVVQLGNSISFYDSYATAMSSTGYKGAVTLPTQFLTGRQYSFAAVDGRLVIAAGIGDIALVVYDSTAHTFTASTNRLLTRDLWGLEETINANYEKDPSYRGGINGQHYYNLQNQSWGIQRKDKTSTYVDPSTAYGLASVGNVFPSNSEQVWPALQFQASTGVGVDPFEALYPNLWQETYGTTTKSPKGYFIIDLLDRSNSRMAATVANQAKYPALLGATTVTSDSTLGGASVVTDFAGRIFYTGFNGSLVNGDARSPILNNYVFFSQLVKGRNDFFKCYQEGDPTGRDDSDLVDTDGGFVRVSGAKNVVAIKNLGNSLIIFAENGVWALNGDGQQAGFTATSYKITKVSSFGCVGTNAVVNEGSTCYYWSTDGIFVIAQNQYGDLEAKSLTNASIQSLFRDIPLASKINCKGAYDSFRSKVRWVYIENAPFSASSITYELIFDSLLNAWTRNLISLPPDNSIGVLGIFKTQPFNTISTDASSEVLSVKYLAVHYRGGGVSEATFSYYHNTAFVDWKILDGTGKDALAYILTGQETAGDDAVDKQVPYLMMFFERTEKGVDSNFQPLKQSSCLFRGQWDFSNSIISNKWTPLRQAYRYNKPLLVESLSDTYDNGFEVIYTKNKLRGNGKAFSLYFQTEPLKDCHILGWNVTINGNSNT